MAGEGIRDYLDKSYIAGLIDGEGTPQIVKHNDISLFYEPRVELSNTILEMCQLIQRRYGGHIKVADESAPKYKVQWKPIYRWHIGGEKVIEVLSDLLPYIRFKKEQTETVIACARYQRDTRAKSKRMKMSLPRGHKSIKLYTDEDLQVMEQYYQRVKKLNTRGR